MASGRRASQRLGRGRTRGAAVSRARALAWRFWARQRGTACETGPPTHEETSRRDRMGQEPARARHIDGPFPHGTERRVSSYQICANSICVSPTMRRRQQKRTNGDAILLDHHCTSTRAGARTETATASECCLKSQHEEQQTTGNGKMLQGYHECNSNTHQS